MKKNNRNIVIALMVAMFLAAFEGTVVTTAMPIISRSLNGFDMISWVFSAYLLTSAISTPVYGKLADLYGRKNILSIGIIIFIIGSSLCGISQNMYQLILFRAIQGIGAGAILSIPFAIIGDVFEIEQRAKVQGWLSTVWGIASLIGPFIGGFLIENLSWNWIFFINVPFGLLSIILLKKNLKEIFGDKKPKIDYLGIVIFTLAILSFLYGVLIGGEKYGWISSISIISFFITVCLLIIFYFVEKRAEDPLLPFSIFTKSITIVNVITFLASAIIMGVEAYMPVYIQNVLGYGPTVSGLTMAPMSITWFLSSFLLAKLIPKYGEKNIISVATMILIFSNLMLFTMDVNTSLLSLILYMFIMGFGFGSCFTTLTIVVQSSINYSKRGAATASNALVRTLGQTIGVSVFGSILNINIVEYFNNIGLKNINPNDLYSENGISNVVSSDKIKIAITSGIHSIYGILIIIAILCLFLALMIPKKSQREVSIKK